MPKINFISIGSYFKEIGDEIKNKNLDTFLSFCMTSKIQAQKVIDFQLQKVNENAAWYSGIVYAIYAFFS